MSCRIAWSRRRFVSSCALGAAFFTVPGAFAEQLVRTPRQTAGPFYPDRMPLDTDNDLLFINDAITPAVGAITWLSGRILDAGGQPLRDALVEIWQVDSNGAYLHSETANANRRDGSFQGYGRFLTGSSGEYLFRTVKPVPYGTRTPHIHFAIKPRRGDKFITQCYVAGEPRNESDRILNGIADPQARASVIVPFEPMQSSRIGELRARFDVVLGSAPAA